MDCMIIEEKMDDFMDGQLEAVCAAAICEHLQKCATCRSRHAVAIRLREILKALPVPPIDKGFGDRVFRYATERNKPYRQVLPYLMKIAAAVLFVFAFGYLFQKTPWGVGSGMEAITVSMELRREIRLLFNSEETLANVTFSLELPKGVELEGFGEQRKIVWEGAIEKGSNLLVLPVTAHSLEGGPIIAVLRHGERSKQFTVNVKVTNPVYNDKSANRPHRYEMSIIPT